MLTLTNDKFSLNCADHIAGNSSMVAGYDEGLQAGNARPVQTLEVQAMPRLNEEGRSLQEQSAEGERLLI